jgi:MYXO-CTERM domain-containing protein
MSGGTLDLTAGTPGAINGSGAGTFSLSGGTLDLGGSANWNYADTYDILGGFASGSVSNLSITGYDTTDYTASVSDTGVLSFAATPEPASWMLGLAAMGLVIGLRQYRRSTAG